VETNAKPRCSARRAHSSTSDPFVPGVVFGTPIPIRMFDPLPSEVRDLDATHATRPLTTAPLDAGESGFSTSAFWSADAH
jgi:hypothetical protein